MKGFFSKLAGLDEDELQMIQDEQTQPKMRDLDVQYDENDLEETGEAPQEIGELSVDVYQTPKEIVVKTMVAGVKPEDLDVQISRDMITIKGTREESRVVPEDDYFHRELYWGAFSRTILLPKEIEVEESEAEEKNGLLVVTMPLIDTKKHTKLKVK